MVRKPQMSQLLRVVVPHGTKPSPILFCCIQLKLMLKSIQTKHKNQSHYIVNQNVQQFPFQKIWQSHPNLPSTAGLSQSLFQLLGANWIFISRICRELSVEPTVATRSCTRWAVATSGDFLGPKVNDDKELLDYFNHCPDSIRHGISPKVWWVMMGCRWSFKNVWL